MTTATSKKTNKIDVSYTIKANPEYKAVEELFGNDEEATLPNGLSLQEALGPIQTNKYVVEFRGEYNGQTYEGNFDVPYVDLTRVEYTVQSKVLDGIADATEINGTTTVELPTA